MSEHRAAGGKEMRGATQSYPSPVSSSTSAPRIDLLHVEIAQLLAWAREYAVPAHLALGGNRAVIRPMRNPSPAQLRLRAALLARVDEVYEYLLACRPPVVTSEQAADAASRRVTGLPYTALVSLTLCELNRWLYEADRGGVRYDPGPSPHNGAPPVAGQRVRL